LFQRGSLFSRLVCVCVHMCQHAYSYTHALTLARAHTYIGRQPSRLDKECLRKLYEFHKQLKAYIAAEEVKLERRHSHAVSSCCFCVCVPLPCGMCSANYSMPVCLRAHFCSHTNLSRYFSFYPSLSLARSLALYVTDSIYMNTRRWWSQRLPRTRTTSGGEGGRHKRMCL